MKIGTKSLLFGVHQFAWHPLTVGLAWRRLYGVWPTWEEWVCIFCHDLGYWGCADMDGPEGSRHPVAGAFIAVQILFHIRRTRMFLRHPIRCLCWKDYWAGVNFYAVGNNWKLFKLVRHHSRTMAKADGFPASKLCWPDKYCVCCEPRWFYILRATLSGEINEYMRNAKPKFVAPSRWAWLNWYRARVQELPEILVPSEIQRWKSKGWTGEQPWIKS